MVLETGSIRLSPSAYGMGRWALASHSNWKLKLFVFVNLLFCLYIFSNLRFWHALPAGGHGDDAWSGDALQRAGEQPVRVHRLDQNHGDGQGGARKEKNLFVCTVVHWRNVAVAATITANPPPTAITVLF